MRKPLISLAAVWLLACPLTLTAENGAGFVSAVGTSFYRNEKPFRYVGVNMWYAPWLACEGEHGDRERLRAELDTLCAHGVRCLRFPLIIQAGAGDTIAAPMAVSPLTQDGRPSVPETLNDTLLAGLDFLMGELARRDMLAVVSLTPVSPWSRPETTVPLPEERKRYMDIVRKVLRRKNRYTDVVYADDPTVMAWQIGFRTEAASEDEARAAVSFITEAAAVVKSVDPYHMVSAGCDGTRSFSGSAPIYQQLHNNWAIDYATLQLWPLEWDWVAVSRTAEDLQYSFVQASQYIDEHLRMAGNMDKPLVIDACSYPRDRHSYAPEFSTYCRADFLSLVSGRLLDAGATGSPLAGFYLWTWAGQGRSDDRKWHASMPAGDLPDEPQGLHAVFDVDRDVLELLHQTSAQLQSE